MPVVVPQVAPSLAPEERRRAAPPDGRRGVRLLGRVALLRLLL